MSKLLEQYLNFKRELDLIEFEPLLELCKEVQLKQKRDNGGT